MAAIEPTLPWEADVSVPGVVQTDEFSSPRLSFASLPPEIREKIWIQSFEPRLITIYLHEGRKPLFWPSAADPYDRFDGTQRPICVTFTASIGGPPWVIGGPPRDFPSFNESSHPQHQMHHAITPHARYKPPRGPVSLRVCRESREVALKHYEPAFPGTNLVPADIPFQRYWLDGRFGEGHIWVNYKRDIICVWNGTKTMFEVNPSHVFRQTETVNPYLLELFTKYASDEATKIRRLALQGVWETRHLQHTPLRTPMAFISTPITGGLFQYAIETTMKGFMSLEELFVYNRTNGVGPLPPGIGPRDPRKEPEEVEGQVRKVLEDLKRAYPDWRAQPEVIAQWDPFQLDQDRQGLEQRRLADIARERILMKQISGMRRNSE